MNKKVLSVALQQALAYSRRVGGAKLSYGPGLAHEACNHHEILATEDHESAKQSKSCAAHRVYMAFVENNGWHCLFREGDLALTPISRKLCFANKEKIFETVRRARGLATPDARAELNRAIAAGRGGVWLELDDTQYSSLKQASNSR